MRTPILSHTHSFKYSGVVWGTIWASLWNRPVNIIRNTFFGTNLELLSKVPKISLKVAACFHFQAVKILAVSCVMMRCLSQVETPHQDIFPETEWSRVVNSIFSILVVLKVYYFLGIRKQNFWNSILPPTLLLPLIAFPLELNCFVVLLFQSNTTIQHFPFKNC